MNDWLAWHAGYDDPSTRQAQRLGVVRRRIREALGACASGSPTVLSLCAGDGRDLLSVLSSGAAGRAGRVVLVELDPSLAGRAITAARVGGLAHVEVRCADAGLLTTFADVLPVDVLLLCGVFGNLEHEVTGSVVAAVPALVAPGGFVVWTRGGSEPDRRPEIRRWFAEAGMEEIAFDGAPALYGVGMNRRSPGALPSRPLPDRLFAFG